MLMFTLQTTCCCFHVSIVLVDLCILIVEISWWHLYTPHSVGLLRTSDRPVAETSIWKHTTLRRDSLPCPQLDSNTISQQATAYLRLRPRGHWDGFQATYCSEYVCSDIRRKNVVCTTIGHKYWILISSLSRIYKAVTSVKCEAVRYGRYWRSLRSEAKAKQCLVSCHKYVFQRSLVGGKWIF